MSIKDLIQKEQKFAYSEFQLKIKTNIKENNIHELGAREIGHVFHEDRYFIPKNKQVSETNELIRLRREGDEDILFTYKGPVRNKKVRNRLVINRLIQKKEMLDIKRNYKEIVSVNKKRTIFLLDSIIINLDKVENLGNFIEFEVMKERNCYKINSLIRKLGLDPRNSTRLSYFELAIMNLNPTQRIFVKIHDKFGKFSFGISSAVLTTLGVMVGLNVATASRIAVIGGIVTVAIADSLSDSMGIYSLKKAERGTSPATALKSALNAFLGKFIFALTFVIPFVIFPLSFAVYLSIIWGLILLVFVNIQIAFMQEEGILKTIIKHMLIAIVIIIVSYFVGKGVALIV